MELTGQLSNSEDPVRVCGGIWLAFKLTRFVSLEGRVDPGARPLFTAFGRPVGAVVTS
jgi:hypothetical protein